MPRRPRRKNQRRPASAGWGSGKSRDSRWRDRDPAWSGGEGWGRNLNAKARPLQWVALWKSAPRRLQLSRPHRLLLFAFTEHQEQRASDIDAAVGPDDDADDHHEGKEPNA